MIDIAIILGGCVSNHDILPLDKSQWGEMEMVKNYIELPEKTGDGAADPFILRYNGWYYLYTTGDVNIWRSRDLADWDYLNTANDANPLSVAYAPEVYYWNGKFYMYTSPSGDGHYILEADEPAGPFNYVTDNLGLTIDGSVFIEDDGTWYFTRADSSGIIGHEMSSPTEINPIGKNLNAYMGHWTEGSMIIKRDNRYYMTYTGNHFESRGYRVNYSVTEEGPFGEYYRPPNNPILINDRDVSHALGHSAFIYGPDLDSMYITYHSYTEQTSPRVLNIDRLSFNGERMYVNGPTWFDMPVATLPTFALWPEDDPVSQMEGISLGGHKALISKEKTDTTFTAEWNFAGGGGDTGILFCMEDKDSYIRMLWPENNGPVTVDQYSEGTFKKLGQFELPKDFIRETLHSVRVQYSPDQFDLYFDGMHKLSYENPDLGSGYIGYIYGGTQPTVGFTGFSHIYKGSGDHSALKPIPGKFDAVHHILEENREFGHGISTGTLPGDVKTLTMDKKGAWVSYGVNVENDGPYGIALQIKGSGLKGAKVKVLQDGDSLGIFDLGKADLTHWHDKGEDFVKLPLGWVSLKSGISQLSFQLIAGKELEILEVELYERQNDEIQEEFDLTRRRKEMMMLGDGIFAFREEGVSNPKRADIKMTLGDRTWTDYKIDVDVTPGQSTGGNSGVIFRTTNESYHDHQNKDAMQGYYVGMDGKDIFLKRMNYEESEIIEKVQFETLEGTTHSIGIEARGNNIKVYWDGAPDPIIEYFDPQPYLFGRVGIWSYKDVAIYSNLKVSSLK